MIFVTVGVSQPFDRLIKEIDRIADTIPDAIFAQIGRTHYMPKKIKFYRIMSEQELSLNIKEADLVITHGGFGSIFSVLSMDKPLIAVPKTFELDKTDNDQTDLVKHLEAKGRLIGVYDITDLRKKILEFDLKPSGFQVNLDISDDIKRQINRWF